MSGLRPLAHLCHSGPQRGRGGGARTDEAAGGSGWFPGASEAVCPPVSSPITASGARQPSGHHLVTPPKGRCGPSKAMAGHRPRLTLPEGGGRGGGAGVPGAHPPHSLGNSVEPFPSISLPSQDRQRDFTSDMSAEIMHSLHTSARLLGTSKGSPAGVRSSDPLGACLTSTPPKAPHPPPSPLLFGSLRRG